MQALETSSFVTIIEAVTVLSNNSSPSIYRSSNVPRRVFWLVLALLCGVLVVFASCTNLIATNQSATPVNTPAPLQSGGLGLTKAEWEKQHRLVREVNLPTDADYYVYDSSPTYYWSDGYSVYFWSEEGQVTDDSRVVGIGVDARQVLSDMLRVRPDTIGSYVSPDQKRLVAQALIPSDAELQGTSETMHFDFERYHSKSLETRYLPLASVSNPWYDDPPGTIYVRYWLSTGIGIMAGPFGHAPFPKPTPTPMNTLEPIVEPTESYVPPQPVETPPKPVQTVIAP